MQNLNHRPVVNPLVRTSRDRGVLRQIRDFLPFQSTRHHPSRADQVVIITRRGELAVGGTSLIYCVHLQNGVRFIEKTLLPKYQGQKIFENLIDREGKFLRELSHPLLLKCIGSEFRPALNGADSQTLLLEYIEGRPLCDFQSFLVTLSPAERKTWAVALLSQLISVVGYLHQNEIIHGDLAPENILVDQSGFLKLIDLGMALHTSDGSRPFGVGGRHHFRAPELRQNGDISMSGDCYALGRIFENALGVDPDQMDDECRSLFTSLIEARSLPSMVATTANFQSMQPLPPKAFFIRQSIVRSKTSVMHRPSFFTKHRPKIVAAVLALCIPFMSSLLPQSGKITINTMPPSHFGMPAVNADVRFETPLISMVVPSGSIKIDFVLPSQNNRRIVREVRVSPGQHVKLFEDFSNLDTLRK